MISICVTQGSKRFVVKCDSQATTVEQFQTLAMEALGLSVIQNQQESLNDCSSASSTAAEFFIDCFPQPRRPMIPERTSDDDGNETIPSQKLSLFDCGVRHQDRIIVVVIDGSSSKQKKVSSTSSSSGNSGPSQQPTPQRSRRKAAIAATESFAATIQQQEEEQMKALTAKASPKKGTNTQSATSSKSASRHFAQLERAANITNVGAAGGRRLRDGAITTTGSQSKRKRTKSGTAKNAIPSTTNGDIAEGLVSATTDTSSSARFMRKGWRQAVESAYEQNQASARVAAGQNLHSMVEFLILTEQPQEQQQQQQKQQQLKVTFKKGVQGRGVYTDIVDYIDHDVLVATLTAIFPSEALRSFHLALLSPRVFWSLLYHYNNHITTTNHAIQDPGDVIHSSLLWCCPNVDWAYLRRRPEQLSEKAKENLRQKQEQSNPTNNMDWEAAAAAILSVEQAMDDMATSAVSGELSTVVNAAAIDGSDDDDDDDDADDDDDNDEWQPFEDDAFEVEELIDCIDSFCAPDTTRDTTGNTVPLYSLNDVVHALSQTLTIRNCYEMATVSNCLKEIHIKLIKTLSDQDKQQTIYLIPKSKKKVPVSVEAIEQWIERARQTVAHFSLVNICFEDEAIVEILIDTLRCSTPKDLIAWESIPQIFVEQVHDRWRNVAVSNDRSQKQMDEWASMINQYITVSNVVKWCRRAHAALERSEWLNDYVTGIEDDSDIEDN